MQEDVLALGRALVAELKIDDSVDTLARWMAHHVAELIQEVEAAADDERSIKLKRCADAILDLWAHRHEFPDGKRPFQCLEPILRSLEVLDPQNPTPRIYRSARPPRDGENESKETRQWLEIADELDYSAKILVRFCLVNAAGNAINRLAEWVRLAESADAPMEVELPIIRFIEAESTLGASAENQDPQIALIEDRISRIRNIQKLLDALSLDLQQRLEGLI
jgi:hypothetical protein